MSFALVAFLLLHQAPSVHAFAPVGIRAAATVPRSLLLQAKTRTTESNNNQRNKRKTSSLAFFKFDGGGGGRTETTQRDEKEVIETKGMPDLISFLQPSGVKNPNVALKVPVKNKASLTTTSSDNNDNGLVEFDGDMETSMSFTTVFSVVALLGGAILWSAGNYLGVSVTDVTHTAASLVHAPQQTMTDLIQDIKDIGPAAPLFFGLLYTIAEILAIPATPLTLSAGYLFGLYQGTAVVLTAGTIAACVAFAIGKTALRGAVEGLLEQNPEFRKLDKAIGKEGFKLLVLVRLTPIFPFAISNYIYGASAIRFWPYLWGTLLGFTPGSFAYVYTGMVGQAVMTGQGDQPWYYYAGGLVALAGLLTFITDTATGIVKAMEDEMED